MQIVYSTLFNSGSILLGMAGFFLALFIFLKKKTKKKLFCPLRANCDSVIQSKYSDFMGIPVELLGMFYYSFVSFAYLFIASDFLMSIVFKQFAVAVSGLSVLFSVYLIIIQGFVIKQWCTWCVLSALISISIFLLAYLNLII
jgi:uncharacterized membrane protein